MKITEILTEGQKKPLGLDERAPRFSWKLESGKDHTLQTACRILVGTDEKTVWDSNKIETRESRGIAYAGEPLAPVTEYRVQVTVWDNHGKEDTAETTFETGFLDGTLGAWEGAKWIGPKKDAVSAVNRGVFVLSSAFRLEPGSCRAGIVFGAEDFRLLDATKNELGLSGGNYIRYEVDLSGGEPRLSVYRVGYAAADRKDVPFASHPLVKFGEGTPVLTEENAYDEHTLRIEVTGNCAFAYLDGILVDAVEKEMFFGKTVAGRQLNPRGDNDVITYPRMNKIGFFAGEGDRACFRYLEAANVRKPGRVFLRETPDGNLWGEKSLFADLPVKDGAFVVEGAQVVRDPSRGGLPMLRTGLFVNPDKKLKKARLYITARGIYECLVNGEKITDALLLPGLTQYDRRINYQTFDITERLGSGENGIGVTLASGWWSDAQTFVVRNYNYFGDKNSVLAKIVLTYADGTRDTAVTNTENWRYSEDGPYVFAGNFAGEIYDAGKKAVYEEYSKAGFDASFWERPAEITPDPIDEFSSFPAGFGRAWPAVNQRDPEILGGYDARVYAVDVRKAVTVRSADPGVYIYDLEQEMAGVPRITFHEAPGTKVIIRYAEVLYPDMEEYRGNEGRIMVENYRDAASTDIYICSGEPGETYQPKFTFHGYRYIEISGVKNPPAPEEVESLQYSSITDFTGSFESDHALLNRFAENVRWSQRCNFINIPTDCPQRNERMGWAGDTHVFCHTALLNSDLKLFYERNIQAMADLQTPEGKFPDVAPVGGGFGGITYECAPLNMAWEIYQQYGDPTALGRFYPALKKAMEYWEDKGLPGAGDMAEVGPLGDWLAPDETDLPLLWNAFYYRDADLMAKTAAVLGKTEDEAGYRDLADRVKDYWNRTFVDPKTGRTRALSGEPCDTQTSYVLGLEYDVAVDRKNAAAQLSRRVREDGHTVRTGFFGTGPLNRTLSLAGYTEDAYSLMLQTAFPSWLYPVTQGATTIWEHWDSYTKEKGFGGQNAMNSFNHYSLGSVVAWLYETVLGIRREEAHPGYEHFILEPKVGPLGFAKGAVETPYGPVRAGWEKKDRKVTYTCRIPANAEASLVLPDGTSRELGSGEYSFTFDID